MISYAKSICILLVLGLPAFLYGAQGSVIGGSWDKMKYLGGAEELDGSRLKSSQREGTLTVSPDAIEFKLLSGRSVRINTTDVVAVGYGSRKWRRDGFSWVAVAAPIVGATLRETMKGAAHFISIEYKKQSGQVSGLLLRAHKTNFQATVDALNKVVGRDGSR